MSEILDFIGVLLHTFGLIIFSGGQVWTIFLMTKAEKSAKPHGKAFVPEIQPSMSKLMFMGILLLLIGGFIRMIAIGRPNLWGNLDQLWGISMLLKHILFVVLVVLGSILMFVMGPKAGKLAPKGPGEKPSPEFLKAVGASKKMGMVLVMLGMTIIVLSVVAVSLG
jgi:uncharacterized membrane protein